MEMRSAILDEMRSCLARGKRLPRRPRPEELYQTLDCNGPATLLATLEYLAARREALAEIGVHETAIEAAECRLGGYVAA